MKRNSIILSLVLLVGTTVASFGQAEVSLGIKGGLNFANINATSFADAYNSRTGYHGGAFVLVKLAKIGIQPELLFSQQGSTVKVNTADIDANFSYVNIPVMLKFYVVGGLNLQVGPQFGFLTGATGPTTSGGSGVTSGDIKSQMAASDVSVGLGAGIDLPFKLTVDARYNLGITNNSDVSNTTVKNQVFQISVGYKLFKFGN